MRAPKTPLDTLASSSSSAATEVLVEPLGELGIRGISKARAVALARVGDQRELADDECCAGCVEE